jgi:hypothetical protein
LASPVKPKLRQVIDAKSFVFKFDFFIVGQKILKKKFKKIKKKLGIAIPQYAKFTEINYN